MDRRTIIILCVLALVVFAAIGVGVWFAVTPGSSSDVVFGCMDASASNYDPLATANDASCDYVGCMDSTACNYLATATSSGACVYTPIDGSGVEGCTDATASNYNACASIDDDSCVYALDTSGLCMDQAALNYMNALPCSYDASGSDASGSDASGSDASGLCLDAGAVNYQESLSCIYDKNYVCDTTGYMTGQYYSGLSHTSPAGACEDLLNTMVAQGETTNGSRTLHAVYASDKCQLFYADDDCYDGTMWTEPGGTIVTQEATCTSIA